MAGTGSTAEKDRPFGAGDRLEARSHFAGLSWINAPIIITGRKQHRWVLGGVAHVVVRRIGVKRMELRGALDGAEFGNIELAVWIQLDSQHVVNTDVADYRPRQVGALG